MSKLSDIARKAGFTLFDYSGAYGVSRAAAAERQLEGKSHYFDAGTRRYFGAQILNLQTYGDDTMLCAVESVSPPRGPRLYRAVVFNVTGEVIHRTSVETDGFAGLTTADKARAELREFLQGCDPSLILRQAIQSRREAIEREARELSAAMAELMEPAEGAQA